MVLNVLIVEREDNQCTQGENFEDKINLMY